MNMLKASGMALATAMAFASVDPEEARYNRRQQRQQRDKWKETHHRYSRDKKHRKAIDGRRANIKRMQKENDNGK